MNATDAITDAETGTNLTAIDAVPGGANNESVWQVVHFTTAGQARAVQSGANTPIRLNTDSTFTTVEMVSQLNNIIATNINEVAFADDYFIAN